MRALVWLGLLAPSLAFGGCKKQAAALFTGDDMRNSVEEGMDGQLMAGFLDGFREQGQSSPEIEAAVVAFWEPKLEDYADVLWSAVAAPLITEVAVDTFGCKRIKQVHRSKRPVDVAFTKAESLHFGMNLKLALDSPQVQQLIYASVMVMVTPHLDAFTEYMEQTGLVEPPSI